MTRTDGRRTARGASEAASAALDVMLTDAALDGPLALRQPRRRPSASPPASRGGPSARRAASRGSGAELTRVAAGRSDLRPGRRDRRFADPAWETSWLFRRLLQTHLARRATPSTA